MDAATVFRLISLIPDRSGWNPSGSVFGADGKSERVVALARLLHWLSPLEALSAENQQILGIRTGGGRSVDEDAESAEEADEASVLQSDQEAGTQLAA